MLASTWTIWKPSLVSFDKISTKTKKVDFVRPEIHVTKCQDWVAYWSAVNERDASVNQ